MSRTAADLLLGQVGDRALDGLTNAGPMVAGMSSAAWALFVALLPYSDARTGTLPLTGAAGALWTAATPATRASMLGGGGGVVVSTPGGLVFSIGISAVGGVYGRTPLVWSFSAATPDGGVLYTVPANTTLILYSLLWSVSVPFTGGTAATLAVRSTNAGSNAVGDLLGGPAGDGTVLGVAGPVFGTMGPKVTPPAIVTLAAGDTIILNRVSSAFTAGAGSVLVSAAVLA